MNDGNWRSNEPNYFNKLLDTWNKNFINSDMYQKVFVNKFDINTVNTKSVSQVISSSFNR